MASASSYEIFNTFAQTSWDPSSPSSTTSFAADNALFLSQQAQLTPLWIGPPTLISPTPTSNLATASSMPLQPTAMQPYLYDLSATVVEPKSSRVVAPSRRASPPSPSSSTSSHEARAPRTIPLHRGEACLHCRKRKIRCDATKPSCGPCSRNGHSCEYEVSPYLIQIQKLESENAQLRARLATLESTSTSCATPYAFSSPSPPLAHSTPSFQPHAVSAGYAPMSQHPMIW